MKKKERKEDLELEEIIDKEKLKDSLKEPVEDSESFIDKNQFQKFSQVKISSPVLEKIAEEQETPEKFFPISERNPNKKKEDEISRDYSSNTSEEYSVSKYDEPQKSFQEESSPVTAPNVNLNKTSNTRQQNFTFNTPESQRMQKNPIQNTKSDYFQPKRIEPNNQTMPFEEQKKQYKEFKLR